MSQKSYYKGLFVIDIKLCLRYVFYYYVHCDNVKKYLIRKKTLQKFTVKRQFVP